MSEMHKVFHMNSFSRSGETLLLRCLNAHPLIHVVHQINEPDTAEDLALWKHLMQFEPTEISSDDPYVKAAGVASGSVILVKNAVWTHQYFHKGFVLARNPFAVANSFKITAEDELKYSKRKKQYQRWAKLIDSKLLPYVNQEENSFKILSVLYNAKMLDASNLDQPVIRYEDFVTKPAIALKRICVALEIEWNPLVLKSHTFFKEGEYGHGGIPLWKDIHGGSLHSYKKLPKEVKNIIYSICRNSISALGYYYDGNECNVISNSYKNVDNAVAKYKKKTLKEFAAINNFNIVEVDVFKKRILSDKNNSIVIEPAYLVEARDCFVDNMFLCYSEDHVAADLNNSHILNKKYGASFKELDVLHEYNHEIKKDVTDENTYLLIGGMKNYWHWLNNFLPRLFIAQAGNINFNNLKLIVNDNVTDVQLQHLDWLGINRDNICKVGEISNVKLNRIYVPSLLANKTLPVGLGSYYLESFKDVLNVTDVSSSPKRVYLSREKSRGRKVYNKKDFDSWLTDNNFTTIHAEDLTPQQQVNIFNNADYVVTPHGAGVANLNFCKSTCKVIIFEYKTWGSEMLALAKANSLEATVILCEQIDNGTGQKRLHDLRVDLDVLDTNFKNISC
ncbi:glycosyltransferase 61 family protein [Cobetia sp. UCD-24C]|uniref:glycosyltransferase 61 family protein n=1 Tax=Cobetia sp. UCD-24C TaxID=1716176 RepID=UPI001364D942|nr:glycosyltransferase 61 family protein [Cobetia sp. UCD-24C]